MEVSAKGDGWGGGQQDEGGMWVQVWRVGSSFPKKNFGSGVGQKKNDNKTVARKQKTELGEIIQLGKKGAKEKKIY